MSNFISIYWVCNMVWLGIITAFVYLFGWWAIPILLAAGTTIACLFTRYILRHA